MIYVPAPSQKHPFSRAHYRFIFSQDETGIAFFQLLVNVAFAALLGAILATIVPKIATGVRRLPKRVWLGLGGLVLIALLIAAGVAWSNLTEAAQRDERYADELLRARHDVFDQVVAKSYFRNAAYNWRLALRFDEATRVENKIKGLQQRPAHDWPGDPVVDLSGLPHQAPAQAPEASGQRAPTPFPSRSAERGPWEDFAAQGKPAATPGKYISTDPNAGVMPKPEQLQTSGYASGSDFAKHAAELRKQILLDVEPQVLAPRGSRPPAEQFPWKTNIVTTVFWIGEPRSSENPKAHVKSAWDANWTANYGGVDNPDPSARRSYIPIAFIPRQNPFYCALPYNDVTYGQFKPEAPLMIPWFKQAYTGPGQSVCWHRWIAIRKGDRTCYAEWEDCGPFLTDHFQYVFGNERPKPNVNHGAGLDVSPAVRDYLGLAPTDVLD
jgi:hypothetical protein